ncbi:hypothetical protein D3C72_1686040 [compost metagenome]
MILTPASFGYPPGKPTLVKSIGINSFTSGHPIMVPFCLPPVFRYSWIVKASGDPPRLGSIFTGTLDLPSGLTNGMSTIRSMLSAILVSSGHEVPLRSLPVSSTDNRLIMPTMPSTSYPCTAAIAMYTSFSLSFPR